MEKFIEKTKKNIDFEPIKDDFARQSIDEGFDWHSIIDSIGTDKMSGDSFYLVVFRSRLRDGADVQKLKEHDARAHEAAKLSPALLHYFGGEPDEEGYCLSFCLWTEREAAVATIKEPNHQAAVSIANSTYSSFALERYYVYPRTEEIIFEPYDPKLPVLPPAA